MFRSILFYGCLLVLATGCKTLDPIHDSRFTTQYPMTLGSIGLNKASLLQNQYTNTAIPTYKDPIKVAVITEPFTKSTFNIFKEAKASQQASLANIYHDSLKNQPRFVNLQIINRVGLITAINRDGNANIKDYMLQHPDAGVITSVSMALNPKKFDAITVADEVFLVQNGIQSYGLQLYSDKKPTQMFNFNEGVVFAYTMSHCCWQENNRHELTLVDLTDGRSCPKNTYKDANKAQKKDDYFKF